MSSLKKRDSENLRKIKKAITLPLVPLLATIMKLDGYIKVGKTSQILVSHFSNRNNNLVYEEDGHNLTASTPSLNFPKQTWSLL